MADKLVLTPMERQSSLYSKLAQHYAARLERLRMQNEADLSLEATAKLRGRIQECKAFLALGNPAPEKVANDA